MASPTKPTAADKVTFQRLRDTGMSLRDIASVTGFAASTVARNSNGVTVPAPTASVFDDAGRPDQVEEPGADPPADSSVGFLEVGDKATATAETADPVRTLAEAVAATGVDTRIWVVDKWECVSQTKRGSTTYKVKLALKRIAPQPILDALERIYERMVGHAPRYPQPPKAKVGRGEECLGVAAIMDAHFGKLSWEKETGGNYDLEIAETTYTNAVDDILTASKSWNVTRWLFPLGNDLLHIDGQHNQTFNGTPQDVDGRYAKVIETAEMAVINAIERLAAVSPVDVTMVPGNHDSTAAFHVGRTVSAWFRNHPAVTVDYSPNPRKYYHWHRTLIGLTHGDSEKTESLPVVMATERPVEWSASSCREWLVGHMHRSRAWTTKAVDSHQGVVIRALRSIAGTDAWHHKRAFISGPTGRGAEVYFYTASTGYSGHAVVGARTD